MLTALLLLLLACAHSGATDVAEPIAEVPIVEATPPLPPLMVPRDPGFSMPIEARIEGLGSAGECATDADCATAGCSAEVCVAATRAADVVTTCEILPIVSELKACTCQEGMCRWVHEAGARSLGLPRTLPGVAPAPAADGRRSGG